MKRNGIRHAALLLALTFALTGCDAVLEAAGLGRDGETRIIPAGSDTAAAGETLPESVTGGDAPETDAVSVMAQTEDREDTGISIAEFYEPLGEDLNMVAALPFSPSVVSNAAENLIFAAHWEEGDSTARLALIDLDKRTVTESEYAFIQPEELWGNYLSLYILNGIPVLYDMAAGKFVAFSRDLDVIDAMESADFDEADEVIFLDASRLIFNHWGSSSHAVVAVEENGTMRTDRIEINAPGEGFSGNSVQGAIDGRYWLVYLYSDADYTQNSYAVYDRENGLLHAVGRNMDPLSCCADRLAVIDFDKETAQVYSAGMPDAKLTFSIPGDVYVCNMFGKTQSLYFSHEDEDGITILRYDPETGNRTGELRIPPIGEYRYAYLYSEWGDSVYFLLDADGEGSLYEWTPTLPEPEESGQFNNLLITGESQNTALISEIYDRFGVSVYTGPDAVRYFADYAALPETDDRKIHDALTLILEFLNRMPEGFVQELLGWHSGLDLCLTGRILPNAESRDSISDAAAFTNSAGGLEYAVFDITLDNLKQTIAHEFLHIIEDSMWEKNWQSEEYTMELFQRWEMLSPPGFEYYWVYTDESGATYNSGESTGQYFTDGDDPDAVYFVDGYSMTYPKEDRARIFEYVATYPEDELPAYFVGRNMRLKAAYLAACIREAFDSITDDVHPVWELDPEYDLEYFREHYDLEAYYAGVEAVG